MTRKEAFSVLSMVPAPDDIYISNEASFKQKVRKCKREGVNNLHVIADFDRTLTKASANGTKSYTTFGWVEKSGLVSRICAKHIRALFDIYHPIEMADKISRTEKNEKMIEWWSKVLQTIVESGVSREAIDAVVQKENIAIREGALEFLENLARYNIPLLIFSAGLGDIIESYLKFKGKLYSDIYVISNFLKFDNNGKAIGYNSQIIHSFNKNEYLIKNSPYYRQIVARKNAILLGDLIEDSRMSDGLTHDCIIKIGFLNTKVENLFNEYAEIFDVVIPNDGSMYHVNVMLKKISCET